MDQPKSVALSCFLYRAVLRLGPSTFRMELQSLLLSDFRHLCLTAHAQAGAVGVFALLPSHMLHTFCDISGEHFDLIKSQTRKLLQAIYRRKRFARLTGTIMGLSFIAIFAFVIAPLLILQSQGISQGINILTIISIVVGLVISVLSLLISFLQMRTWSN